MTEHNWYQQLSLLELTITPQTHMAINEFLDVGEITDVKLCAQERGVDVKTLVHDAVMNAIYA